MRGNLDASDLKREFDLVRSTLAAMNLSHLNEFSAAWTGDPPVPPGGF
jgi:hypothetical protein